MAKVTITLEDKPRGGVRAYFDFEPGYDLASLTQAQEYALEFASALYKSEEFQSLRVREESNDAAS